MCYRTTKKAANREATVIKLSYHTKLITGGYLLAMNTITQTIVSTDLLKT